MSDRKYYGVVPSLDSPVEGVLRNASAGLEFPFSLEVATPVRFRGRIRGLSQRNTFLEADGWTFVANKPPLPTVPGFYSISNNAEKDGQLYPGSNIFQLTSQGKWYDLHYNSTPEAVEATVKRIHESGFLVRLSVTYAEEGEQ